MNTRILKSYHRWYVVIDGIIVSEHYNREEAVSRFNEETSHE
jgi:hypothetical protein